MRTNIEIDDTLMAEAMEATGAKTKREAVEIALKQAVQRRKRLGILELEGKIQWEGDLEAMRLDRGR